MNSKLSLFINLIINILTTTAQCIKLSDSITVKELKTLNREAFLVSENGTSYLRCNEQKGEGIVWLPVENFSNGTIVLKLRGKNELQKSFIGIAFHGRDDTSYDAVYCRPFNFKTNYSIRKTHAMQYISHPIFTWSKLRHEQKENTNIV